MQIKKINSFGCSLIFGTDLKDDGRGGMYATASNHTWPALLAKKFNLKYTCFAAGGSGNLQILDRLLRVSYYRPDALFVVQWTYADRFDYSDPNGIHFNNGTADYKTLQPLSDTPLASMYYRELHSEYRDKLTNLIYIKTAIDFLQSRGCKFFMTCVDDTIFDSKWHAPPHVIEMQEQILPHINKFEGENFVAWSKIKKFPISDTMHPLEEAHLAAADLQVSNIDAILHRA